MSRWKIFYTDGTALKNDGPVIGDDPTAIPKPKRWGVHSVIQEMEQGTVREIIQQYHYLFLISQNQWIGVGMDGLIDYLANHFNDIACVLHGRTTTSDSFRALRDSIAQDTDVIGGISAARVAHHSPFWSKMFKQDGSHKPFHYANGTHPLWEKYLPGKPWEDWTDMTRHRMYDPDTSPPGPYGEERLH
jgi:hypothetical protein